MWIGSSGFNGPCTRTHRTASASFSDHRDDVELHVRLILHANVPLWVLLTYPSTQPCALGELVARIHHARQRVRIGDQLSQHGLSWTAGEFAGLGCRADGSIARTRERGAVRPRGRLRFLLSPSPSASPWAMVGWRSSRDFRLDAGPSSRGLTANRSRGGRHVEEPEIQGRSVALHVDQALAVGQETMPLA